MPIRPTPEPVLAAQRAGRRAVILSALMSEGGHRPSAAKRLRSSVRAMQRWMSEDSELSAAVTLGDERGWKGDVNCHLDRDGVTIVVTM